MGREEEKEKDNGKDSNDHISGEPNV